VIPKRRETKEVSSKTAPDCCVGRDSTPQFGEEEAKQSPA